MVILGSSAIIYLKYFTRFFPRYFTRYFNKMLFKKSLIPLSAAIFLALDPKYSLAASMFFAVGFKYREYLIGEYEPEGKDVEEYEPEGGEEEYGPEGEDVEEYEPESEVADVRLHNYTHDMSFDVPTYII